MWAWIDDDEGKQVRQRAAETALSGGGSCMAAGKADGSDAREAGASMSWNAREEGVGMCVL